MNKKISILIFASVVALIALSLIQAYLIKNTYELKKDAFISETKKAVSGFDNAPEMDSLGEIWYGKLTDHLVKYKKRSIKKEEAIQKLQLNQDSINTLFKIFYNQEIERSNLEYDIKYKKSIISIVLYEGEKRDTIFSDESGKGYFLFGEDFPKEQGTVLSKARWFTEHDYEEEDALQKELDIEIRTEDSINIIGWKHIVLGQMTGVFIFSILLFLFVVGLLFYSIRNLIQQKKLADIRTDFINNITHELKTPMATLSIAAKSLQKKEIQESPNAFKNTLQILDRQNNRLQKLVDQVVDNSLGSDKIILNKEEVVDTSYFNELFEDFRLSVQEKNVNIKVKIEVREVYFSIDKFLFTTALNNILENAVKYGGESAEIVFRTYLKDDQYKISIHDNGIGIPEKEQQKIFDKFYRVIKGNVHNVKGLGLGLFYADQIIKSHQGSISLESREGVGTTFIITMPISKSV